MQKNISKNDIDSLSKIIKVMNNTISDKLADNLADITSIIKHLSYIILLNFYDI